MRLTAERAETEGLFETLANESPVGICIIQDGKFCYTNPTFQHNTGYKEDELLGKNSLELIAPEDREMARENAIKMLRGELTSPHQFRVMHEDGSIHWVVESVASVQYRGRRAILASLVDITEHKQVEEKLKDATQKWTSLLENTSDFIMIIDSKGKIRYINRAIPPHNVDRVVGKTLYDFAEPEHHESIRKAVAKVFETRKEAGYKSTVKHPTRVLSFETVMIPIIEGGKVISAMSFNKDITEREQADDALQAERNKLQSVIGAMEDGLSIQDKDYNIIYQNEPLRKNYGDHLGEKCYRVYEGRDKPCDGCPVKKAFKDGKSHTSERSGVLLSGEVAFAEVTANPIRDAEGNIVSCLEIVRNITERKKTERELSKTQAQLSSAMQMAHLGPWEYDAINDLFIFNDAFYDMFHTTAEEVGGYTMSSAEYARRFVHPEDALLVGEEVRKALQADNPNFSRQLDHRIVYADGKVGYISVRFFIVKDETGRTVRTYGVNQDITERKQVEEDLQAEKNKLQSLIDALEYTITIQDTEYNIIYQNEPSKIASGGDHLGEKCYRAYEGRKKICARCPVEKAFKDGKTQTAERRTKISGKVAFWENTAIPIRDAKGKIVSCMELARDVTERKEQEQTLADELTQRRLLIDKSLDGIVVLDEDARVVEANQRFAEMLGYTLEEVRELHTWDWDKNFPPEKILEMGQNVDEKGLHLETKHTRKDGSVIDVDISISGIMYGGQKLIFCIQRDITERNQAEEALQIEKNKLQSLIDAMDYTITIQDTDYSIIFQNEPSKMASGGDHVGEKCYRAYEGREKICDGCPVKEVFKDGETHTTERMTEISGKVTFWENTATPIRDAKGKIVSCIELARDITERRRMEEALRDSEEKLRKMFESVTDGISVIDLKGSITEVNERAVEMHGFSSRDELRGKSAFELVASRDHERIAASMKKAIKQGTIRSAEYTLIRADGSEFPAELSTSVLKDVSDNVVGHITIVRDVTERKRAREEREALLQDIKKSNRRLEGANKELQDFVYVASHDLREPLRKISSFGTLLQDSLERKLDEDQQENLGFMIDGARRMQDMIEALLSYSRLTTKAEPLQQVFLDEVIENLKELELATLLDETRGTVHIPEPLPPVRADPSQMNQLFQNLIGNGLKFHQEGIPPKIIIRAHGVENKMIQIEVEDNGIGIDEKYHEQLFVMFKRLHSRAKYEGTGIGLAICKKIVERHGGSIGVKSTPGKGSTFWFTLPRGSYLKED